MTTEIKTKYRTIEGQDIGNIRILDENYEGVAVSIGRISIDGNKEDTKFDSRTATLSYDYDILELPTGIKLDESFDKLLGDIIVDILETKLENDPGTLRFEDSED